jgi:hypothetical protein
VKARKPAISKRGTPRKSRRPRFPGSDAKGRPEFNLSDDDWRRIENAYRYLSMADRETITGIKTAGEALDVFALVKRITISLPDPERENLVAKIHEDLMAKRLSPLAKSS